MNFYVIKSRGAKAYEECLLYLNEIGVGFIPHQTQKSFISFEIEGRFFSLVMNRGKLIMTNLKTKEETQITSFKDFLAVIKNEKV